MAFDTPLGRSGMPGTAMEMVAPLVPGVSQPAQGPMVLLEQASGLVTKAAQMLDPQTGQMLGRMGMMLRALAQALTKRPDTEALGAVGENPLAQGQAPPMKPPAPGMMG